ncbi:MAG: hypothetical protein E7010_05895 [Alphaproteobacteria bacterium]|nr:hypothetical protein [Alphaproteobacteria bacterium]
MSTLSRLICFIYIAVLALFSNAGAALYGFSETNPLTPEEQKINLPAPPRKIINYRQALRDNIDMIADYAHAHNADFQIVLHEGEELLNKSLWEYHRDGYNKIRNKFNHKEDTSFLYKLPSEGNNDMIAGTPLPNFSKKINAIALNNVFCNNRKLSNVLKHSSLRIISIDYCPNAEKYEESLQEAFGENILFYGFTNLNNAFNNISKNLLISENAKNIFSMQDAKNILFLTDDSNYSKSYDFIRQLQNSNYDVIVIPALFQDKEAFSPEDINSLKFKKNGTTRLVLAEMNITEANTSMYYWKKSWHKTPPEWIARASFVNKASYIARYWHPAWQKLLGKHIQGIIQTGFSGVFITGIHNHSYFEAQEPLE